MPSRLRLATAHGILLVSAVAIAAATVWYFAGTSREVTVAAAKPGPAQVDARLAADAFVGAVKAKDAAGVCTLLSRELRGQHADCESWARGLIGETEQGSYIVLAVVMQAHDRARVRMLIDGSHYFWFFRHQADGWRFESAKPVPRS